MAYDFEGWINISIDQLQKERVRLERELGRVEGQIATFDRVLYELKVAHENEDLDTMGSGDKSPNPEIGEVDIRSTSAQFPNPGKYSDGITDTEDPENPTIVGGKYARLLP